MKVSYSKSSEKEILSLEKVLAQRIAQKIMLLEVNPYSQGSQKLSGNTGYRIRIGDYRVIYTVDKIAKTVTIIKVAHRKEVYR
jgi:mRNA interferase RelE/StbE